MSGFEIVSYLPEYRAAFRDLNVEWLEHWFKVEPVDEVVLNDPEGHILGKGGEIFFGVVNGIPLGTVALKTAGDGVFELSKLGVTAAARGTGMGRALSVKVIERFKARGGHKLFLETNSALVPAIRLYETLGFVAMEPPVKSLFERADYYMEWQG